MHFARKNSHSIEKLKLHCAREFIERRTGWIRIRWKSTLVFLDRRRSSKRREWIRVNSRDWFTFNLHKTNFFGANRLAAIAIDFDRFAIFVAICRVYGLKRGLSKGPIAKLNSVKPQKPPHPLKCIARPERAPQFLPSGILIPFQRQVLWMFSNYWITDPGESKFYIQNPINGCHRGKFPSRT